MTKRFSFSKIAMWLLLLIVVGIAVAVYLNRTTINGYADVGTSYAARVACSCRFVAERSLEDC